MTTDHQPTTKDKFQAHLKNFMAKPKLWGISLALASLTIGFAGGIGVSSLGNSTSQHASRQFPNHDQGHQPPNMEQGNEGQERMAPPGQPNDNQDSQDDSDSSSKSTTPPDQAKSKNQETEENQETDNGFTTETN
ncbi:hypothetical protein J2T50_001040 [Streptococcus gallinaceus]|uniref:hypothetical protein n=1 Tax=Streptococcus gallinaceus TaxID=165758 RepID=UPI00209D2029|nr:hypothetical protein [Streptococcus gallinaceus]MCP1639343.1 hypothetical protein [Streptococcus gallinaceus]MCP1770013.1 hypothetical protein [Streptococcus gallinaceus]